ncbi:MAG: hypothetical protein SFV17_09705 [Candidatus Obscuribacter sp.]|nr:hypothetical protein [Candidatus Obscuribacter sp.]
MKERKQKPAEHTEGKAVAASPASAVDTAVNEKGDGKAHSHGSSNDPLKSVLKSLETTSFPLQAEAKEASEAKPATAPTLVQGTPASISIDSGTRAEIERQLADHVARAPLAAQEQVKEPEPGTPELSLERPSTLNYEMQDCERAYPGSEQVEPIQKPEEPGPCLPLPGERKVHEETRTGPGRIEAPLNDSETVRSLPERATRPLKLDPPPALPPVRESSPEPLCTSAQAFAATLPPEEEAMVLAPETAMDTAKSPPVRTSGGQRNVSQEVCRAEQKCFSVSANAEKLTETSSFQRLLTGIPLFLTGSPSSSPQVSYLLVPLPPAPLAERSEPSKVDSPTAEPPQARDQSLHFCFLPLVPGLAKQTNAESREGDLVPEKGGQVFTIRPLMPVTVPQSADRVPLLESERAEKPVSHPQPGAHLTEDPGLSAVLEPAAVARPALTGKRRDRYYISGPDLVFAAIIALASTASRRHDDLPETVESGSPSGSVVVNVLAERCRPSLIVSHGDSLEAIAERYFNDRRLGHLIADLNERVICQCQLDGKRIVRIKVRQVLHLPLLEDISDFHSRRANKEKCRQKLLTIVEDTEVSKEVLLETFKPFLKRLS